MLGITPDLDPPVLTHLHLSVLLYEWVEDLKSSTSQDPSEGVGSFVLDGCLPGGLPIVQLLPVLDRPAALPLPGQVQRGELEEIPHHLRPPLPVSGSLAHGGGSGTHTQSSTTVAELCPRSFGSSALLSVLY